MFATAAGGREFSIDCKITHGYRYIIMIIQYANIEYEEALVLVVVMVVVVVVVVVVIYPT